MPKGGMAIWVAQAAGFLLLRPEVAGLDGEAGGSFVSQNEVVVPVRLPNFRARGKAFSSCSGRLTAAAVRYRRLKTAFVRGLYFQLIIRSHMPEYDGAPEPEAKVAGEKRKRDSSEGSEGGNAAESGAGAEVEGEPRMQSCTSSVPGEELGKSSECPENAKRGRGRPPQLNGSSGVKKQRIVNSDEQKRKEAAVSAFLSDLPDPLLKALRKDA